MKKQSLWFRLWICGTTWTKNSHVFKCLFYDLFIHFDLVINQESFESLVDKRRLFYCKKLGIWNQMQNGSKKFVRLLYPQSTKKISRFLNHAPIFSTFLWNSLRAIIVSSVKEIWFASYVYFIFFILQCGNLIHGKTNILYKNRLLAHLYLIQILVVYLMAMKFLIGRYLIPDQVNIMV